MSRTDSPPPAEPAVSGNTPAVSMNTLARLLRGLIRLPGRIDPEGRAAISVEAGGISRTVTIPAPVVATWHNAVIAKGLRGQASLLAERGYVMEKGRVVARLEPEDVSQEGVSRHLLL